MQAGTAGFQYWDIIHGWHNQYRTFVENTGASDPNAHYFFDVSCNAHIYVKVWGGDCMYLLDIDNGLNTSNQCYLPVANIQSAEAIVELNPCPCYPNFADFTSVTFHGVGITNNGSYKAMYQAPHDKAQIYDCLQYRDGVCIQYSAPYATVGDIQSDPNDIPYDKYSVTWQHY